MFIFQMQAERSKQAEPRKALELDLAKAGMDANQKATVLGFFDNLVKYRKQTPLEAQKWANALCNKEEALFWNFFSSKKSMLELYGDFTPEERLKLFDLAAKLKSDEYFGGQMRTFDERHGNTGNSAFRYLLTSLHTALKKAHDVGGKEIYQAENIADQNNSFVKLFNMAKEIFSENAGAMFKKIQPKETSGVLN